jgi:hypothetical protein
MQDLWSQRSLQVCLAFSLQITLILIIIILYEQWSFNMRSMAITNLKVVPVCLEALTFVNKLSH